MSSMKLAMMEMVSRSSDDWVVVGIDAFRADSDDMSILKYSIPRSLIYGAAILQRPPT